MKQSCLREVNSRQELGTFKPATQNDQNCTAIGTQAEGAKAASKVLSDYLSALNSLASFGAAKTGTDAQNLIAKAGAIFGAGSPAQNALSSIAQFLVTAATSGYQQKQLENDLPAASGSVTVVINALVSVIQDEYIGRLLNPEEQKLAVRYQEFVVNNSKSSPLSPDLKLSLHDRWQTDEAAIAAKRASAQSLVTALQAVSKGLADLAANSHKITAKEVTGLLAPYDSQIQALIPAIQKAF